jgi:hypothetical protein
MGTIVLEVDDGQLTVRSTNPEDIVIVVDYDWEYEDTTHTFDGVACVVTRPGVLPLTPRDLAKTQPLLD